MSAGTSPGVHWFVALDRRATRTSSPALNATKPTPKIDIASEGEETVSPPAGSYTSAGGPNACPVPGRSALHRRAVWVPTTSGRPRVVGAARGAGGAPPPRPPPARPLGAGRRAG